MQVLDNPLVVITEQYVSVFNQHIAYLKLA